MDFFELYEIYLERRTDVWAAYVKGLSGVGFNGNTPSEALVKLSDALLEYRNLSDSHKEQ